MNKKTTPSIDQTVAALTEVRQEIRELNKELASLKETATELEESLIEQLDAIGSDIYRNEEVTASVSETQVPQVVDWERFYTFIKRNDALYLLQRRPSATAFREMLVARKNRPIPGVETYTKRSINLRTRQK